MNKFCPNCGFQLNENVAFCPNCGHQNGAPIGNNTEVRYAGFWVRAWAYFIDVLIVGAIGFAIGALIGIVAPSINANDPTIKNMFNVLGFVISWLYFAVLESSNMQATIGKKAMSLKVIDENNARISFGRATGRYVSKILSGMILFFGYIMVGLTANKQGLHDMIAKTYVVKNS